MNKSAKNTTGTKKISKLESFEVISFSHASKVTGGGGCGKSDGGGGGDTELDTARGGDQ